MKKNYVIDTNVMLHDPNFINSFEENHIIIPLICIEELDHMKKENTIRGYNARMVLKTINKFREMSETSISEGVELPNGGTIRIEVDKVDKVKLPDGMSIDKNDNKILAITMAITNEMKTSPTILVTKDLALSIKADSLGIQVQDYENDKIEVDTLYRGIVNISVPAVVINSIFAKREVNIKDIEDYLVDEEGNHLAIYPNEFVFVSGIENPKQTAITKCVYEENTHQKKLIARKFDNFVEKGMLITPRNVEQKMTMDILMDDSIPFTSISGKAGCGKTILTMSVALQKLEEGTFNKLILVRPVVPAGDDIGFLPGTEDEKLKPWMGAFYDAVESILRIREDQRTADEYIERLKMEGKLEIKSFTYMRGRTLSNAFVIIDEAQEITPHIAKLMLTRVGENTKIVMTGDPSDNQIDNALVNSKTNGLVYVIEKCKDSNLTAHIELEKVERSALADLFNKVL